MTYPENGPPTMHDRELAETNERLALYGLVVSARCSYCGRPIWQASSLQEKAGRVCARRNRTRDEKEAA